MINYLVYDQEKLDGLLVGCDLLRVEPVPGAILLSSRDFTNENSQKEIIKAIGRQETFDVVLSDMAPNASGIKSLDQDRIINLAMKVRDFTLNHGRFGSCLVIKVWQTGSLLTKFTDLLKEDFKDVQHFKPDASRKDSAEIYIVARSLIKSPVWQFES